MSLVLNLNICRICMKTNSGSSLSNNEELKKKFCYTTRLAINENDNMPTIICAKCVPRLRAAYDFIRLAHSSDKNIRIFLDKISDDFEEVTKCQSDNDEFHLSALEGDYEATISTESDLPTTSTKARNLNKTLTPKTSPTKKAMEGMAGHNTRQDIISSSTSSHSKIELNSGTPLKNSLSIKEEIESYIEKQHEDEEEDFIDETGDLDNIENEVNRSSNPFLIKSKFVSENEGDDEEEYTLEKLDEGKKHIKRHATSTTTHHNKKKRVDSQEFTEKIITPMQNEPLSNLTEGYLKEYESMLEENIEYVIDENTAETMSIYESNIPDSENELTIENLEEEEEGSTTIEQGFVLNPTGEIVMDVEEDFISLPIEAETVSNALQQSDSKKPGRRRRNNFKDEGGIAPTSFYCFKCNRDFSTKTNLTRHMRSHGGYRPYKCDVCEKSFTQNGSLKQHMYTHTGEKPFVCSICNRGFTQCKSLVFHMRRHTGEKPFTCDKCGILFRQKDGLKTHLQKHHIYTEDNGDIPVCVICKEELHDKVELELHMKKHLNNHRSVDELRELNIITESSSKFDFKQPTSSDLSMDFIGTEYLLSDKAFLDDDIALNVDAATHVINFVASSAAEPSRAKKFQCRTCFKCFAIKKSLIRHLTIHQTAMTDLMQNTGNENTNSNDTTNDNRNIFNNDYPNDSFNDHTSDTE